MKKFLRKPIVTIIISILIVANLINFFILVFSINDIKDFGSSTENSKKLDLTEQNLLVFDLERFINSLSSERAKYDYLKVAATLQGLANREQPILYYKYESNGFNINGTKMDDYWLSELKKNGKYFENYNISTCNTFYDVINSVKSIAEINGVVIWDDKVPATSNVASTIAGVENLIPIRYDTSGDSAYTDLVINRNIFGSVKRNLVNVFENIDYLPDQNLAKTNTGIASTGSAKNDAYLWAKKYYIDTGKTSKEVMAYSRDSWISDLAIDNARFVYASLPEKIKAGEEVEVSVTVLNNCTQSGESWSKEENYRIAAAENGNNNFQITWAQYGYEQGSDVSHVRIYFESGNPIEVGEMVTIKFRIKAPTIAGDHYLNLQVVHDGQAWINGVLKQKIEVISSGTTTSNKSYSYSEDATYVRWII